MLVFENKFECHLLKKLLFSQDRISKTQTKLKVNSTVNSKVNYSKTLTFTTCEICLSKKRKIKS